MDDQFGRDIDSQVICRLPDAIGGAGSSAYPLKQEIKRALGEQLGLALVPARRPVKMLVIERASN